MNLIRAISGFVVISALGCGSLTVPERDWDESPAHDFATPQGTVLSLADSRPDQAQRSSGRLSVDACRIPRYCRSGVAALLDPAYSLPLLLLDFGPSVFEGDAAVENRLVGSVINRVGGEVTEAFELDGGSGLDIGE